MASFNSAEYINGKFIKQNIDILKYLHIVLIYLQIEYCPIN